MKVNSKKGFGYIADPDKLGTISSEVIDLFAQKMNKSGKYASSQDWIDANSNIIYYARQLKAQHDGAHVRKYKTNDEGDLVLDSEGHKIPDSYQEYSDMYYLEYALRHINADHLRDLNMLSQPTLGINSLNDPLWSQYSPEEIIQMADSGYVIPDQVLVWAHSMREADITSYVVLSDEGGVDGEEESGVDTDINSLRKQATDYILKVNKEQENIDDNTRKIEQKQKEVKKIEEQNRFFKKYSIEKIKKDADELKNLESKEKEGKLDIFEKAKLKKLRKQLSEDSSRIKNLKDTEAKMNDFLDSIESLQEEAQSDIQLADDTVAAAEELAKLKNDVDENSLTSESAESLTIQNRGLSNILAGALTTKIPDIADKVATELRDTSQEVMVSLDSEKTEGHVDFAKNYAQGAQEVQEVLGLKDENEDGADNLEEDAAPKTKNGNNEFSEFMSKAFWFVLPFTANPVVAYLMTVATLASMDTTKDIRNTVADENKELKKGLKEYKKSSKKLEEETKKAEAEKDANAAKMEEFNAKLAELNQESLSISEEAEQSVQEAPQSEAGENDNSEEENIGKLEAKIGENDAISTEKDLIYSQIDALKLSGSETIKNLKETVTKTDKILKNNIDISKSINANSAELQKSKDTTKSLSAKSVIGGHFTASVGIYNLSVAVPLLVQATAMMASVNPVTVSMGVTLAAIAKNWIGIGTAQTLTGAGEVTAGAVGFDEAGNANIQLASNKEPLGAHGQNVKMSKEQIKQTNEALSSYAMALGIEVETENSELDNEPASQEKNSKEPQNEQLNAPQAPESENNATVSDAQDRFEQAHDMVEELLPAGNPDEKVSTNKNANSNINQNKLEFGEKVVINKKEPVNNPSFEDQMSEADLNLKIQREKNLKYKEEQEQEEETDKEIELEVNKEVDAEEQEAKIQLEKEKQEEEQKILENQQTLVAAASTGVNLYSALDNSDKAEKKLTRFNNDSIIESRKKARRVTAISAAQKKRA